MIANDGSGLPKKSIDDLFVAFSDYARTSASSLDLPIACEIMRLLVCGCSPKVEVLAGRLLCDEAASDLPELCMQARAQRAGSMT